MSNTTRKHRILLALLCLLLLLLNSLRKTHGLVSWAIRSSASPREVFIQTYLDNDLSGPYDGAPLQDVCRRVEWREGLIIKCGRMNGGVGNVRNGVLTCVRVAIAAGAQLVIPHIEKRANNLIKLEGNGNFDFGQMFDTERFISALRADCPQLKLYESENSLWNVPSTAKALEINANSMSRRIMSFVMSRPDAFRVNFDHWLKERLKEQHPQLRGSAAEPVQVALNFPLLHWRMTHDEPELVAQLGKIVRFPRNIRELTAKVLFAMQAEHGIKLQAVGITPGQFLGAHLRTEADADRAGYQRYEAQSEHYLDMATRLNLSRMYVACGHEPDLERMRAAAAERDVEVLTKYGLLAGDDLRALTALRWDQQALVDYGVLERASVLGGIEESSFAFNLAMKRHLLSVRRDHLIGAGEGITFEDEFTWLYGRVGGSGHFVLAMWP